MFRFYERAAELARLAPRGENRAPGLLSEPVEHGLKTYLMLPLSARACPCRCSVRTYSASL